MLTSPVPLGKIVFGKYLAMVGVFSIAMIVVALTPLFLSIYGSVPLEKVCGVFGILAAGLRMYCDRYADVSGNGKSGYRSSAWICSTVSWLHDVDITSMISQSGNLLTKILNAYDLYTPLDKFMNGLRTSGVIIFLSVIESCF